MKYNSYAFLVNHINILISTRRRWSVIKFNKKLLKLLFLLKCCGVINSSVIFSDKKCLIKISPLLYKKSAFYKGVRLVSTPSKSFNIRLKALRIIDKSLGNTFLILETSKGLVTHQTALRLGIGGRLLCVIG